MFILRALAAIALILIAGASIGFAAYLVALGWGPSIGWPLTGLCTVLAAGLVAAFCAEGIHRLFLKLTGL